MEKRVTMSDIAVELGLSINAVSLSLNNRTGVSETTRNKVLKKAEELGYFDQCKKYITTYSNKNICVLLEGRFFHDMQFYGQVLLGLEKEAKVSGYNLFINSFEKETESIPDCVLNKKVFGMVVIGKIADDFLTELKSHDMPVVLVDYLSLRESTDCIVTDNKAGTYKITSYLFEQGFRKIGFFGGIEYSPSVRERFWGYQEAMQELMGFTDFESSMRYIEKYSVLNKLEEYVIANSVDKVMECIKSVKEIPEAIVCCNDLEAILLCKALDKLGLNVPGDISIVGFDNVELSKMIIPQLTTVNVDKELMGRKGIRRLIYRMEHPEDKIEKITMDVQIVERASVKRRKRDENQS